MKLNKFNMIIMLTVVCAPGLSFAQQNTDRNEGMTLKLTGIYSRDEVLCYRLETRNRSPLVYDVAGLRVTVRDRKVVRRHAFQEVVLTPLWIRGDSLRVGPGQKARWRIALPKEVLSREQYLCIRLLEQHGQRDLLLKIGYRSLLRAKIVNDL
jgi:hypothetical protein